MIRRLCYIIFTLQLLSSTFAQTDDDLYFRESTIGVNLNTAGGLIGGLSGRLAYRATPTRFNVVGLDILHIKHPKELKYSSAATGNGFIPGKTNNLFSVRPTFSQELLLFQKYPEEGVQISAVFGGGPSFGFLKPYFIEYDYTNYNNPSSLPDYRTEPYNPEIHTEQSRILGSGGAFSGFGQMDVLLGINAKAALNLEFGKFKDLALGVEAGVAYEIYSKPIELYPIDTNPNSFSTVYVVIYMGNRK